MAAERTLRVAFLGAGNVVRGLLEYWPTRDFPVRLEAVSIFRRIKTAVFIREVP